MSDSASTRATPQQGRSAQSIDAILDAAERLSAAVGVAKLSTVSVAAEAGVSVGKIYYWFDDKAALVAAVERRVHDRLVTFLDRSLTEAGELSTPALIDRFLRSFVQFMVDHPGSLPLLEHRSGHAGTTESTAQATPLRSHMAALIDGLIASRVETSTQAERELIATMLTTMAVSLTFAALDASPGDRDDIIAETVYAVSGYLALRYPSPQSPMWSLDDFHIRPARPSTAETNPTDPVFPARADP